MPKKNEPKKPKRMPEEAFLAQLKKEIAEGKIKWRAFPTILSAENANLFVNETGKEADLQAIVLGHPNLEKITVKCERLVFKSHGDWALCVYKFPIDFFENRDHFDRFIVDKSQEFSLNQGTERISLEEAFEKIGVHFELNLEWYKKNRIEMEKDWGEEIDPDEYQYFFDYQFDARHLLYKLLCRFIDSADEELDVDVEKGGTSFMVTDFRLPHYCGNCKVGSCQRGKNYLAFHYFTS